MDWHNKAFINVRASAAFGRALAPVLLDNSLHPAAAELAPRQPPPKLGLRYQNCAYYLGIRLHRQYTCLHPGMAKYMNASVSVYVYALILLDRAQEYNQHFTIHSRNIHRLLLASNLVSAKYLDDNFYKNSYYATIGGVTLKGLN